MPRKTVPLPAASSGLQGFRDFEELRTNTRPTSADIYAVIRPGPIPPAFSTSNLAGGRRDFTEPLALLADQWVEECQVLYIGLARSGSRRTVLRRLLSQYRRTGAGAADNHASGV